MADPQALWNARPQRSAPVTVYLDPQYWDGQFTSDGMQPSDSHLLKKITRDKLDTESW